MQNPKELKAEIDKFTIIDEMLHTDLSVIKYKKKKENNLINI